MRDEKRDKELKDTEKSEEKVRVTDKRRISPDNLEGSAEPLAEAEPKPTALSELFLDENIRMVAKRIL